MNSIGKIALRAIKWLLVAELAYLLVVNAALNVTLTQDIVNLIRPEKYHVAWENAWSWYPFRVHARGIHAHGQSRSQQWEVRADAASGSISVLPLVAKRVHLSEITAENVDYRQRPRLKADRDYSAIQDYFPEITDRAIVPADVSPRKKKRPWKLFMDNARAGGELSYWIYNLQGSGQGTATANLTYETRGGPFSLDVREMDLQLAPAYLNDTAELFHGGTVRGRLSFDPFVPRENKGVRMLPFLTVDAELDLQVGSLGFIDLFTANVSDLAIGGAGRVEGRLHYERGYARAGTGLTATADGLSVNARGMQVLGQGEVRIHTPEDADMPLVLDIAYDALTVTREQDEAPFIEGDSLRLVSSGSNYLMVDPDTDLDTLMNDESHRERRRDNTLDLLIDDATMVDLSVINDYLPAQTGFRFTGGTAQLQADVSARVQDMDGALQLNGEGVSMLADGQDLRGDLAIDLVIAGGVPREMRIELDGSSFTLDRVSVVGAQQTFEDDLWSAQVLLTRAEAVAEDPPQLSAATELRISDTRPMVTLFHNHGDPPNWVSRLLVLKDIQGQATLELADNRLQVTDAQVLSDKAEVAAKAVLYESGRHGVIYARYRKLDVVLKMEGTSSNLDVLKAREKFDAYVLSAP